MGLESYSKEDIARLNDYVETPEGRQIAEDFVFRAIATQEFPHIADPDYESDPNSYRLVRIVRQGSSPI